MLKVTLSGYITVPAEDLEPYYVDCQHHHHPDLSKSQDVCLHRTRDEETLHRFDGVRPEFTDNSRL